MENAKKQIILILLIVLALPLVNADVISINSAGDTEIVLIPNELIEGFFFSNLTLPESHGAGGTGRDPFLDTIDSFLCNETYFYIQEHPEQPDYSGIYDLIDDIESRENITYSWTEIRDYIDHWQYYCSDALKRTLMEGYVCGELEDFLQEHETYSQIEIIGLRDELAPVIPLSIELLNFYLYNFDDLCTTGFFITQEPELAFGILFLLAFLFAIVIILFTQYGNKKFILFHLIEHHTKK
jgi:hypothetical protein